MGIGFIFPNPACKSAALEYATPDIRVNDVCPGMIPTPMLDKMIAEGQGPELEMMLKTFVPMKRLGPAGGDCRCRPVAV